MILLVRKGCLTYPTIAMKRHQDQGNSYKINNSSEKKREGDRNNISNRLTRVLLIFQ